MKYLLLLILVTGCTMNMTNTEVNYETAYFAGGCFWCMEAAFEGENGVIEAINGYAQGSAETATYEQVSSGTTKHVEGVEVRYLPKVISYNQLLDVFWKQIDPTDTGGQFADRGPQYEAMILYKNDDEKLLAEESKNSLDKSGKFAKPIVTKIEPFKVFYPAEEYHQNYYKKRVLQYESYSKGSGRKDFIEDNWS